LRRELAKTIDMEMILEIERRIKKVLRRKNKKLMLDKKKVKKNTMSNQNINN